MGRPGVGISWFPWWLGHGWGADEINWIHLLTRESAASFNHLSFMYIYRDFRRERWVGMIKLINA